MLQMEFTSISGENIFYLSEYLNLMVVEKLLQMIDELRLFTLSPNDKLSPIH